MKKEKLKTTQYTFFSSAHGTFSTTDHILGHKSSFGKFKKIEIISVSFPTTALCDQMSIMRKNLSKIQTHGG